MEGDRRNNTDNGGFQVNRQGLGEIFESKDFLSIHQALEKLRKGTRANSILLLDTAGRLITSVGRIEYLDVPSLASLSAAEVSVTKELAALIGEQEFTDLFHKGKEESISISLVNSKVILVVLYDRKSILGLVRVRVNQTLKDLSGYIRMKENWKIETNEGDSNGLPVEKDKP